MLLLYYNTIMLKTLFIESHNFLNIDASKLRETMMNLKTLWFECECNDPLHRVECKEKWKEILEYYMEERTFGSTKIQIQRRPWLKAFAVVKPINWMISEIDELLLELNLKNCFRGRIEDIYSELLWIDISKLDIITFDCPPRDTRVV